MGLRSLPSEATDHPRGPPHAGPKWHYLPGRVPWVPLLVVDMGAGGDPVVRPAAVPWSHVQEVHEIVVPLAPPFYSPCPPVHSRFVCVCVCVCVCDLYFERWILVQRWAGHPIWLRSAEASVERWTPPFCGIRTSVVGWLSIQCVCSPRPRQKKRAGDVLCYGLLQALWDRHWGGPWWWCFRPPALGGWRGDGLVWGPRQTWWVPCGPLQAWFCGGLGRLCGKSTLPVRWHWGAHFVVSPLAAVAHPPLFEGTSRAWRQVMQRG